jgi:hypothetical protein
MKIIEREKSTLRLSPSVRVLVQYPQQEIPQSVAGFFDLVEENEAYLERPGVMLVHHFLAEEGRRFATAEVSRGRADQLGYLVAGTRHSRS